MKGRFAVILLISLLAASRADATYSIAGADRIRKHVGVAVISCVPFSVSIVAGTSPGNGAVAAQALVNEDGRDQAVNLLGRQTPPQEIMNGLTTTTFDPMFNERQYGIVDVNGLRAAFTGTSTQAWAGHRSGASTTYAYSAQGNILTSQKVIDQASSSFEQKGCDLADRLMLALEAGAQNGEGDSRCRPQRAGSSAFLTVDVQGIPVGSYLRLDVENVGGDPLEALRAMYTAWRADNPCPGTLQDGGMDLAADPSDMGTSNKSSGCGSCALGGAPVPANLLFLLVFYPAARRIWRSRR